MSILISIGTFLLGAALAIAIFAYQERAPDISVICRPVSDDTPSTIECEVMNTGRKESKDIVIGFLKMLPKDTNVFTNTDVGAELRPSRMLPNPQISPNYAEHVLAFSVNIPRVAAKSNVVFRVKTENDDNERAAQQLVKIRKVEYQILDEFNKAVSDKYPHAMKGLDIAALKRIKIKKEIFFSPGNYTYENGSFPVQFLTEDEKRAEGFHQDIYSKYKKEFLYIFKNHQEKFKAPVLRILTPSGESTYALLPPYPRTYVEVAVPLNELKEKGVMKIAPSVPESYD